MDCLHVIEGWSGRTHAFEVRGGAVEAQALSQVRTADGGAHLRVLDPGCRHTAVCESAITQLDGDSGRLGYRGHTVESLARGCSEVEVAHLLVCGDLPSETMLERWHARLKALGCLDEATCFVVDMMEPCVQPLEALLSCLGVWGQGDADRANLGNRETRESSAVRALAGMTSIAARLLGRNRDSAVIQPTKGLVGAEALGDGLGLEVSMPGLVNPHLRALRALMVVQADHGMNCSTTALRIAASAWCDPYLSLVAATATFAGSRHGGEVAHAASMLYDLTRSHAFDEFVRRATYGEVSAPGFGHCLYRGRDPRAEVLETVARNMCDEGAAPPLLASAKELEERFASVRAERHHLRPNSSLYCAVILDALGCAPSEMPLLMATARSVGWISHWLEAMDDRSMPMFRPLQIDRNCSKGSTC